MFLKIQMNFSVNTFLRYKIFAAIVSVNFLFMVFMGGLNFYRDSIEIKQSKKREINSIKEKIQETFVYIISQNFNNKKRADSLIKQRVFEIANVNNVHITLYNLQGKVLASSKYQSKNLDAKTLLQLSKYPDFTKECFYNKDKGILANLSYGVIKQTNKKSIVLEVEKMTNEKSVFYYFKNLIKQFLLTIIFLVIISAYLAWYISKNLTRKIEKVAQSLEKTNVVYLETPIIYHENDEIKPLVNAYNAMLEKLQEQTLTLAKTEREEAWRDMARQIAHEINNPLTPLKLSVQNFQRKYNPDDADNVLKIKNLTQVVVNQIDIISSITQAFSEFAKLPMNKDAMVDVVKTVKYTVDIFPDHIIEFYTNAEEIYYQFDNIYLTRIITNLVKNAIQSIEQQQKKVIVKIENQEDRFIISIKDNGSGISDENKDKVFEEKFTTKSSGMGLGLYMVKQIVEDYNGKIWFETVVNEGTTFFLEFLKPQYK